jgi:hypothetical protein
MDHHIIHNIVIKQRVVFDDLVFEWIVKSRSHYPVQYNSHSAQFNYSNTPVTLGSNFAIIQLQFQTTISLIFNRTYEQCYFIFIFSISI